MQIDKTTLTSLITRLEEEYGKATPFPWKVGDDEHGEYLMILQDGPEGQNGQITSWSHYELEQCHGSLEDVRPDATFIADAHNSLPTLLGALKHYMKVAEAGERLAEAVQAVRLVKEEKGHGFDCTHCIEAEGWNDAVERIDAMRDAALAAYREAIDTP